MICLLWKKKTVYTWIYEWKWISSCFDCKCKYFILSQRLVSARITFFYIQYPAISKILAILTKNDNSSRSGGRWNTSKSSIAGGIGVSFSSDSSGCKCIVKTPFPQMSNLFRIRRNGFERIKVTQYFCYCCSFVYAMYIWPHMVMCVVLVVFVMVASFVVLALTVIKVF